LLSKDEQDIKIKQNRDYFVGGLKMSIQDIRNIPYVQF
jgi:hypothetical protein